MFVKWLRFSRSNTAKIAAALSAIEATLGGIAREISRFKDGLFGRYQRSHGRMALAYRMDNKAGDLAPRPATQPPRADGNQDTAASNGCRLSENGTPPKVPILLKN